MLQWTHRAVTPGWGSSQQELCGAATPSCDSDTSPCCAIHCARHQFAIITTQSFGSKTTEHYLPLQLAPRKHKAREEQSCKHKVKGSSSSTPHRAGATTATKPGAVGMEPYALPLHHTWGTALGDPPVPGDSKPGLHPQPEQPRAACC